MSTSTDEHVPVGPIGLDSEIEIESTPQSCHTQILDDWKLGPSSECKVIMGKIGTEIPRSDCITMDTEENPRKNTNSNPNNGVVEESCDSVSYLRSRSSVLLDELKDIFAKCENKCSVCDKYMDKLYEHFKQTHAPVPVHVSTDIPNDDSESTQQFTVEDILKLDPDDIDNELNAEIEYIPLTLHDILYPESSIVDLEIPGMPQQSVVVRPHRQRQLSRTRQKWKISKGLPYSCNISHKKFSSQKTKNDHKESTHFGKKEKKKTDVQTKKDLTVRLKTDGKEMMQYSCEFCDKHFSTSAILKQHEGIHTATHKCKECGKSFRNTHRLKEHVMTHTGEKPHPCPYCDKKFSSKSNLNKHTPMHTGKTLHQCEHCGKTFRNKGGLKVHTRSHTDPDKYSCETCGKGYRNAKLLESHTRTHTGEKPYLCQTCGKSFNSGSTLINHEKIHTGEKPYSCESCGKGFNHLSNLRRHRLTHTGEKRYVCQTCGKDFAGQQALTHHTRIHTGEKPYSCETCGKSFSVKTVFNKHSCNRN